MRRILIICLVLCCHLSYSQVLPGGLSGQNLSGYRVDDLSDDQVRDIAAKMAEKSVSLGQLESMATSRGMSTAEFQKLKMRLETVSSANNQVVDDVEQEEPKSGSSKTRSLSNSSGAMPSKGNIFGQYLFRNSEISFEPNLNIPTPRNYILAGGDQIDVTIWGASQYNYRFKLNSGGEIVVPFVGVINLSGQTIESATGKLKGELSKIYSGLLGSDPTTFITVNLSEVRSIKVNMMGQISVPGSYTLPGFASVFNALYAAGGPNENGSFRSVRLVRGNKTIATIDLYNLLIRGELDNNVRLEDQDVIFVDNYISHVKLEGPFKSDGIFEVRAGETLDNLMTYCGGFTSDAYRDRVILSRKTSSQSKVVEVDQSFFSSFVLQDGDEISSGTLLARFENRVEVKGAVYRSGFYELTEGLTLADLIEKCQGFTGDAFKSKVSVYRQKDDLSTEVLSIDASNGLQQFKLQREDVVYVPSVYDLRETWHVEIEGEVQKPGKYSFAENASFADVIVQAGGLLESASFARIEVARRARDPLSEIYSPEAAQIFVFSVNADLSLNSDAKAFKLKPFDHIVVRRSPAFNDVLRIQIDGEVLYPGSYILAKKQEYISDILLRSGGITPRAYGKGAYLIRVVNVDNEIAMKGKAMAHFQALEKEKKIKSDSILTSSLKTNEIHVPIDLDKILDDPQGLNDLVLIPGDRLVIPQRPETVSVSGMVWQPALTKFQKGYTFQNYISCAGGFANRAKKSNCYVIYANGSIDKTNKYLFFNDYPKVEPGSEIIVPSKPEKNKVSTGEAVSMMSAITTMALVAISVISISK